MADKSAVTAMPVLVGFWPKATLTVNVVESPCKTVLGFAEPKPESEVQSCTGVEVLRGFGAPVTKSSELLSVSKQPLSRRRAAVVFESVGAGPVPSKQVSAVPYPTKSISPEAVLGQLAVMAVVLLINATLVELELTGMVPIASGVGRLSVPPAP